MEMGIRWELPQIFLTCDNDRPMKCYIISINVEATNPDSLKIKGLKGFWARQVRC